jgi:phosphoglycerate dehydrogenase-like enzyme
VKKVIFHHSFPEDLVDKLRSKYPGYEFVTCLDKDGVFQYLKDAEVLISFRCTHEMLDASPNLKWIQAISAGVDSLPLDEIKRRGIILTNGRGIHKIHMSEYAIAVMISLSRNMHILMRNQLNSLWNHSVPQGEIYGKTLGILGLGSIGREIAKKASLFGMKVTGIKNNPEPVEYVDEVCSSDNMDMVFRQSDYIINLLPSTPETHRIIDDKYFSLMKKDACFINMGRGKTVNEEDLIKALQARKFRAMASDVYYEEPLDKNSPLWGLDNVILTPHICGESEKYEERAFEIVKHNMESYVSKSGQMMNLIDLEIGY